MPSSQPQTIISSTEKAVRPPIRLNQAPFLGSHSPEYIRVVQERWIRWDSFENTPRMLPVWKTDRPPSMNEAENLLCHYVSRGLLPQHNSIKVLGGGAAHKLFILDYMSAPNFPKQLVLRLCIPSDPYYALESEVATTMLVESMGLPVPHVYAFDSSAQNPLQLEWSLIELATHGDEDVTHLHELAPERNTLENTKNVFAQLRELLERVRARSFRRIGSLYYDWDIGGFFVGKLIHELYQGPKRSVAGLERGPWTDIPGYVASIFRVFESDVEDDFKYLRLQEERRLEIFDWPKPELADFAKTERRKFQVRAEAAGQYLVTAFVLPQLLELLRRRGMMCETRCRIQHLSQPGMVTSHTPATCPERCQTKVPGLPPCYIWHVDLHEMNFFVRPTNYQLCHRNDDGRMSSKPKATNLSPHASTRQQAFNVEVASIIDWEGSPVVPLGLTPVHHVVASPPYAFTDIMSFLWLPNHSRTYQGPNSDFLSLEDILYLDDIPRGYDRAYSVVREGIPQVATDRGVMALQAVMARVMRLTASNDKLFEDCQWLVAANRFLKQVLAING